MLSYIFLIGLVIPAFCNVIDPDEKVKKIADCNDPEIKSVGDGFLNCLNITLDNQLHHNNATCDTPLDDALKNYVSIANKKCIKDDNVRVEDNRSLELFTRLINYTMRLDGFKDFVENGGVTCIKRIKSRMSSCVMDHVRQKNVDIYATMWAANKMTLHVKPCQDTYQIMKCTMKLMQDQCEGHKENRLYVGSLFNYMLDICNKHVTHWDDFMSAKGPMPMESKKVLKGIHTTHVLLGLLLTFAIVGFIYVIFRECKNTGRWKVFNEQFEMRQRRRSLVHNEVCENN